MRQIGKHKKLKYIECAYWTCPYYRIEFRHERENDKWCEDTQKGPLNLAGHEGSNAPKWCQRRQNANYNEK